LNDAARSGAQDLPHIRVAEDGHCGAEVRSVEDVEKLRPELKAVILVDWDVLEERHIPVRRTRPVEQISPWRACATPSEPRPAQENSLSHFGQRAIRKPRATRPVTTYSIVRRPRARAPGLRRRGRILRDRWRVRAAARGERMLRRRRQEANYCGLAYL